MSKYTTEVRYICEVASGLSESKGYNSVEEIIETARPSIFDFDYPIFDPNYKPILERKILRHFYTREIGEETVGLWKLRLNTILNEIMPYYNQLYKSELIEFDPITTHNISTEHSQSTSTSESQSESAYGSESLSATNWDKFNDTPQGSVGNLDDDTYMTSARKVTNNNNATNNSNNLSDRLNNTLDYYLHKVIGYSGVNPNKLLDDYRKNMLNIDMLIIRDLEDLFMQLW